MAVSENLQALSVAIDKKMEAFFRRLGQLVYRHTYKFLFIPIVVAILLSAGLVFMDEEFDPEKLYTPDDAPSFDEQGKVEASFGFPAREGYVYAARSPGVSDLLNTASVLDWYDTWKLIEELEVTHTPKDDDGPDTVETLATVCVLKASACRASSVLAIWNYNRALIASKTDAEIKEDYEAANGETTEQDGAPLNLARVVKLNAAGEAISFQIVLVLEEDLEEITGQQRDDPQTGSWELAAYDMLKDRKTSQIAVYSWFLAVQDKESASAVERDVNLLSMGFVLLLIYAIVVLTRRDPFYIHSHSSLAVVSFVIALLAITATFGTGILLGCVYSTVVAVLAFLLLGLGMDDTFVIHAAYMDPDVQGLPAEERAAEALARAGTSITVTSMTDVFAFLAGSYTTIPSIRAFCQFAAIGALFDFILQVTSFMAVLVLSSKREAANRRDWVCCYVAPADAGGCIDKSPHDTTKDEILTVFMRDYYAPALLSKKGKAIVSVASVAICAFSIWAMLQIKIDFDLESFVPDDSHLRDTFDIREEYWGRAEIPTAFYTFNADYKSVAAQTELGELTASINNATFLVEKSCDSWWTPFIAFATAEVPLAVTASNINSDIQVVDTASFDTTLAQWLRSTTGQKYVEYLRPLNINVSNTTLLQASQIPCAFAGLEENTEYRIAQMEDSREIAEKYPTIDATSYNFSFLFIDGYVEVKDVILTNIGLAILAVLVLTTLLLGNFFAAFIVGIMITMIDIEVLMLWYAFGDTWNYVTGINLVLAVGLSVDPLAHITHSFLRTSGTGDERAHHALSHIGRSVLNGVISTSVILLPLLFSSSYIFQVFGKCIISIMILSVWHGLAVLPVLLSVVQPASYSDLRKKLGGGEDMSTVFPEPESNPTGKEEVKRITAI